ncbi:PREDICTED: GDSL esterase/lipase At5g03610-like isoform X2 [Ipomoea nil]|uniref:GDSL esterase/lipase At5g03610-like isoform X2 n=1 Tax=Ipomoea nil TaxID=35883 RepID=UPI000900CE53|nr:PREDICTED: GDSL esterase/lipase At5g03610-like isoform X2 [Ipomoea nil]
MEKKVSFTLAFFLCVLIVIPEVGHGADTKLFVFGDSYADTGNTPPVDGFQCWEEPYGITFPGKPSGRFSDGRVLTDFIAEYLGIRSPVPYRGWKLGLNLQNYGMNFAYGGTGVFNTINGGPNMTSQINDFQQLIQQRVFTKRDLSSSVAHVSAAGNDYGALSVGGQKDIESVISELVLNLKRIYSLGVPRISVVAVPPFGCMPQDVVPIQPSPCNESDNSFARLHNQLLKKAVEKLNTETGGSTFVILDLYSAFMYAFNVHNNRPGKSSFVNPWEECCKGRRSGSSCGDVDEDGRKEYVVCEDPKHSFFWDAIHPSQQGWLAVFSIVKPSLNTLFLPHAPFTSASVTL